MICTIAPAMQSSAQLSHERRTSIHVDPTVVAWCFQVMSGLTELNAIQDTQSSKLARQSVLHSLITAPIQSLRPIVLGILMCQNEDMSSRVQHLSFIVPVRSIQKQLPFSRRGRLDANHGTESLPSAKCLA